MKSKGVVIRLPTFKEKKIEGVCEVCQFGKQHRHPFPKERNVRKGLLDVIHSDIWGLTQSSTFGGCRYYVLFIDEYSGHTSIYQMRQNSEVFDTSKDFLDDFMTYLRKEGIQREFTCWHSLQQNGVAELKNRHIHEVARAMMNAKHMPKSYWAEAVNMAVYLMNRCTTSIVHEVTP